MTPTIGFRRLLAAGALALVAAVGCGGSSGSSTGAGTATYANPAEGVTKSSIKLAWMGDASGPTASSQLPQLEAIQAYFNMVNDKGGILGRKVTVVVKDDKYQAPMAVSNFKDLTDNETPLAILGLNGSAAQSALAKQIDSANIPDIGPLQTDAAQLNRPNIWNLMPTINEQSDVAYYQAKKTLGSAKMTAAIVYLNVPSGVDWDKNLEKLIKADGGEVPLVSATPPGTSNLDVTAQKVAAAKANVVFYHGGPLDATGFLIGADKVGLNIPIYGWWSVGLDPVFKGAPAKQAANFFPSEGFTPPYDNVPGAKDLNAAATKYGSKDLNISYTYGWVTAMVAAEAIKRAGDKLNRSTLSTALAGIKNLDTGGLSPAISFDSSHRGVTLCMPYRWDAATQKMVGIGKYDDYKVAIHPGD